METYDPETIGKRIAWLGEHTVYRYGEHEVIKFSKLVRLGLRETDAEERDADIGKQFLGERMLDTRVVHSPDGRLKALVQSFVYGRVLRKRDLRDPDIAKQFDDLRHRHGELVQAGHAPVDLMSGMGFLMGSARNIFLVGGNNVKVIDVTLVDMLPPAFQALVLRRQDRILASYLTDH